MRKILLLIFIILCSTIGYTPGYAPGYASDLSDTFSEKYNSLVPPSNSSVHSDYLFEQIALGSEYTIKLLDQMNRQNDERNEKIDILVNKFDTLIEQNKQIIKLLEKKN